jgi:hypothetical protein
MAMARLKAHGYRRLEDLELEFAAGNETEREEILRKLEAHQAEVSHPEGGRSMSLTTDHLFSWTRNLLNWNRLGRKSRNRKSKS